MSLVRGMVGKRIVETETGLWLPGSDVWMGARF